jgi:uncharacterized membrane protein
METLDHIVDIKNAYLLGTDGSVLTHSSSSEWSHVYTDRYHRAAIGAKNPLFQRRNDHTVLYSLPVSTSAVLCATISLQRVDTMFAVMRRNAFLLAAAVSALFSWILFIFLRAYVINPLDKVCIGLSAALLNDSHQVDADGMTNNVVDEINGLLSAVRERTINAERENEGVVSIHRSFVQAVLDRDESGLILVDDENRVYAMNSAASTLLKVDPICSAGRHVLDLLHQGPWKEALLKAGTPGIVPVSETDGKSINCIPIFSQGKETGKLFIIR